jgi:hypothetical protein
MQTKNKSLPALFVLLWRLRLARLLLWLATVVDRYDGPHIRLAARLVAAGGCRSRRAGLTARGNGSVAPPLGARNRAGRRPAGLVAVSGEGIGDHKERRPNVCDHRIIPISCTFVRRSCRPSNKPLSEHQNYQVPEAFSWARFAGRVRRHGAGGTMLVADRASGMGR